MILGDFQFSLKTIPIASLSRSTEFKWVDTERVGDLPYVQNLGIAKDNIEIEGVFYPKLNGDTQYNSIEKFVEGTVINKTQDFVLDQLGASLSGSGKYQTIHDIRSSNLCKTANNLITDSGEILGKFVIITLTENQTYFNKKGSPQKVEFSMTLKRTPGVQSSFINVGSSAVIDLVTGLAKGFLKW
jgi:phage protein U